MSGGEQQTGRFAAAIRLAAELGQIEGEVVEVALDQLASTSAEALSDVLVAFWLDVPVDVLRALLEVVDADPPDPAATLGSLRTALFGKDGAAAPVAGASIRAALAASVRAPADRGAGLQIPGFEVLEAIGQGAMGTVYRARQIDLRRDVAIKVLDIPEGHAGQRFLREARAAASVHHPHVVTCYAAGHAGDALYVVLELVDGGDVESLLRSKGSLPEEQALSIARDACLGLVAIEEAGLVHRDIKPANILLTSKGRAKLADLGLARSHLGDDRVTQSGIIVGTPVYMAPEQALGEAAIDVRADVYALGATLFHLVTGRPPFAGGLASVLAAKDANARPPDPRPLRPDLSSATARLLERALAASPDARHQGAKALLVDLEAALLELRPRASAEPAQPARRAAAATLALALVVVLVVVVVIGLMGLTRNRRAAPAGLTGEQTAAAASNVEGAASETATTTTTTTTSATTTGSATTTKPAWGAGPGQRLARARGNAPRAAASAPAIKGAPLVLRAVPADRVEALDGRYAFAPADAPWDRAALFAIEPNPAPFRIRFRLRAKVERDAPAGVRAEQGFSEPAGFFFEAGLRADHGPDDDASDLGAFALWVTVLVDEAGAAHGLVRIATSDRPRGDTSLRLVGEPITPGVAIVNRFTVPAAFAKETLDVRLIGFSNGLFVRVFRGSEQKHSSFGRWATLPIPIPSGDLADHMYVWAQLGNWDTGLGHGSIETYVD